MIGIRDAEVKNLKVGDVIYERDYGVTIEARVLSAPVETGDGYEGRKQWRWQAENTQTGTVIDYLITEGFAHYGPHLYRSASLTQGEGKTP